MESHGAVCRTELGAKLVNLFQILAVSNLFFFKPHVSHTSVGC